MKKKPEPYTLPINFYNNPSTARATITTAQLKTLLLNTGGYVVTHGSFWTIKKKSLGVGIYTITLEDRPRGEPL